MIYFPIFFRVTSFLTQFQWHEANVLDNWQLARLPKSGGSEFDPHWVHDNSLVPLWVYMSFLAPEHQNYINKYDYSSVSKVTLKDMGKWGINLEAIIGVTNLVPNFQIKSLQLILKIGTCKFHLQMSDLHMSCRDLTTRQDTRIIASTMAAAQQHDPLSQHFQVLTGTINVPSL